MSVLPLLLSTLLAADALGPGFHARAIEVDGRSRSYFVHVPASYASDKPTPVVLVLHGSVTNGAIMAVFSGLNNKADEAGFLAVYPNGTGKAGLFLAWNAGGSTGPSGDRRPDDVKFVDKLLDDLAGVVNVDQKRVYATGHSNGGMMCYRLAAELPHRIAAIAPVSATMARSCRPKRPVAVMHFHGTADKRVPFGPAGSRALASAGFRSVADTIRIWAKVNRCSPKPATTDLPDKADDGTSVKRMSHKAGRGGAEVVLFEIRGGGHTWPGQQPLLPISGKSTNDISANDLMWEFFRGYSR